LVPNAREPFRSLVFAHANCPVFHHPHALPSYNQGTIIKHWVDTISNTNSDLGHGDALRTDKRQRVLRDLSTTSQRSNTATHIIAAGSPTRRLMRRRSPPKKKATAQGNEVVVATQKRRRRGSSEEADADTRSAANALAEGELSFLAPASSLRSISASKQKNASTKMDLGSLHPTSRILLQRVARNRHIAAFVRLRDLEPLRGEMLTASDSTVRFAEYGPTGSSCQPRPQNHRRCRV
jgi:hypothetical protein